MTLPYDIETILVDASVATSAAALATLDRAKQHFPKATVACVDQEQLNAWQKKTYRAPDSFGAGKKILYLTNGKGLDIHACPGTQKAYCCNYYVVDLVENCPFDCTYCYLQSHLNSPFLKVYVNIDEFLIQIKEVTSKSPEKHFRIGTGELADSLALEPITGHADKLVPFFADMPNATLELKTKSNLVDSLLNLKSAGNTIIAWSVNPAQIGATDEFGTATLEQRLQAAKQVIDAGYQVAFHFDPIIRIDDWNQAYMDLLDEIDQRFPKSSIAWLSLGTLRFPKGLRRIARQRFPESKLPLTELTMGVDHKERYLAIKRVDVYERMIRLIREKFQEVPTYLCMENSAVWQRIFDGKPRDDHRLTNLYG